MTDQATKDAIDNLRLCVEAGERALMHPTYLSLSTILVELDRLRKPIEDVEIGICIGVLRNAANAHAEKWPLATLVYSQAANLIECLARENERLRAELDQHKINAPLYFSARITSAEARAQRYAEAIGDAIKCFPDPYKSCCAGGACERPAPERDDACAIHAAFVFLRTALSETEPETADGSFGVTPRSERLSETGEKK